MHRGKSVVNKEIEGGIGPGRRSIWPLVSPAAKAHKISVTPITPGDGFSLLKHIPIFELVLVCDATFGDINTLPRSCNGQGRVEGCLIVYEISRGRGHIKRPGGTEK